jgi:hypothetical protein
MQSGYYASAMYCYYVCINVLEERDRERHVRSMNEETSLIPPKTRSFVTVSTAAFSTILKFFGTRWHVSSKHF